MAVELEDELLTCDGIAAKAKELWGGGVSAEYVRAACHRAEGFHPLPCKRSGETRPVLRIFWSEFCEWFKEERRIPWTAGRR